MKKLLLVLLFPLCLNAQVFTAKKGVTFTGKAYQFFLDRIDRIESIGGETWLCFPKPGKYFIGEKVAMIDGFPVPVQVVGNVVSVKPAKMDLLMIDFKTKKVKTVKNGDLSSCRGYPKNPKEKMDTMKGQK